MKNALSAVHIAWLQASFAARLFPHQAVWNRGKAHKVRNILTARQVGATWYFAAEAFLDAVTTGESQIFLVPSPAMASVAREYIVEWVGQVTGVRLVGDPITLPNGAVLGIFPMGAKDAGKYTGNVCLDAYAWMDDTPLAVMAAVEVSEYGKWRRTYVTQPNPKNPEARAFWRSAPEHGLTPDELRRGALCPDGHWRHMVTIEDAASGGCRPFDLEALRREYSPEDFAALFLCQW